jgi:hypothetical protein
VRCPRFVFLCSVLLTACGQQPVISDAMRQVGPELPVDFSGSWQRNYARDDDISRALRRAYDNLARTSPDRNNLPPGAALPGPRDAEGMIALARLAEQITRFNGATIVQNDQEIRVEREDDFALVCRFNNGVSETVENAAGVEVCGWDGKDLVSQMSLSGGLTIVNRLTLSADGQELRIVTTLTSPATRAPFSLRRFFTKYDRPASEFHCVETLTMKRVCSTREIEQ